MSDYGIQTGPEEVTFARTFDAPVEKVWQFLVDPEKRRLWFCGGSTGTRPGEAFVLEFDHRHLSETPPPEKYASEEVAVHHGEILEYDPPRRLAFTWFESAGNEKSVVAISLAPEGEGRTRLDLVHTGIAGREMLVGVLAGWHGHFDLMAEVLTGERETDFWTRDQQLEREYETRV